MVQDLHWTESETQERAEYPLPGDEWLQNMLDARYVQYSRRDENRKTKAGVRTRREHKGVQRTVGAGSWFYKYSGIKL